MFYCVQKSQSLHSWHLFFFALHNFLESKGISLPLLTKSLLFHNLASKVELVLPPKPEEFSSCDTLECVQVLLEPASFMQFELTSSFSLTFVPSSLSFLASSISYSVSLHSNTYKIISSLLIFQF